MVENLIFHCLDSSEEIRSVSRKWKNLICAVTANPASVEMSSITDFLGPFYHGWLFWSVPHSSLYWNFRVMQETETNNRTSGDTNNTSNNVILFKWTCHYKRPLRLKCLCLRVFCVLAKVATVGDWLITSSLQPFSLPASLQSGVAELLHYILLLPHLFSHRHFPPATWRA